VLVFSNQNKNKNKKNMNYQSMPDSSRVWVYQSNRILNDAEVSEINKMAQHFVPSWDAHGAILSSSITVHHHLFIVILVDEQVTQISGCAIDKSVAFIKRVEQQLNIHFFDRMNVAYQKDNMIETCTMHEFQTLLNEGKVDDQTLVFNNLVSTKKEFDTNWKIPLQKSWHKRLLNTPAI
jgi:hypothetical protein